MAKYDITKVVCPKCNMENTKRTWKNINVNTNPDLKDKLMDLSLFRFKCSECGYEAILDYSLTYEDDYRIYYVTEQQELDEVLDLLSNQGDLIEDETIRFNRVVCTQDDLLEKVNIFDLGLDDKVIEVIKVLFFMNFRQQKQVEIDAIQFKKNEKNYQLRFMRQGFEEGSVQFDQELYNRVKEKYEEYMEEDVRIDFDWATSVLMKGQVN